MRIHGRSPNPNAPEGGASWLSSSLTLKRNLTLISSWPESITHSETSLLTCTISKKTTCSISKCWQRFADSPKNSNHCSITNCSQPCRMSKKNRLSNSVRRVIEQVVQPLHCDPRAGESMQSDSHGRRPCGNQNRHHNLQTRMLRRKPNGKSHGGVLSVAGGLRQGGRTIARGHWSMQARKEQGWPA